MNAADFRGKAYHFQLLPTPEDKRISQGANCLEPAPDIITMLPPSPYGSTGKISSRHFRSLLSFGCEAEFDQTLVRNAMAHPTITIASEQQNPSHREIPTTGRTHHHTATTRNAREEAIAALGAPACRKISLTSCLRASAISRDAAPHA
jgi:hypothetical protein